LNQRLLRVHYLPRHVRAEELAGGTVVVIDLLRATTTICQALASGAAEVAPFLEIDDALAAAKAAPDRERVVLGGERRGIKIVGFDLGNSPAEYTPEAVGGRRVFITTTNGTRALHHAWLAARVVVGALVNLSAVAASVRDAPRVDILCAGTDGAETSEDILAAGAMVHLLVTNASEWQPDERAAAAQREWRRVLDSAQASGLPLNGVIEQELQNSQGGKNLLEIGNGGDLALCAEVDCLDVVPEFDVQASRISLR
jgi:2-phosphosulfolactate phosphatase